MPNPRKLDARQRRSRARSAKAIALIESGMTTTEAAAEVAVTLRALHYMLHRDGRSDLIGNQRERADAIVSAALNFLRDGWRLDETADMLNLTPSILRDRLRRAGVR